MRLTQNQEDSWEQEEQEPVHVFGKNNKGKSEGVGSQCPASAGELRSGSMWDGAEVEPFPWLPTLSDVLGCEQCGPFIGAGGLCLCRVGVLLPSPTQPSWDVDQENNIGKRQSQFQGGVGDMIALPHRLASAWHT